MKVSQSRALIGVVFVALFILGVLVGLLWLSPSEEKVVQVAVEGPARAYPQWVLVAYHVVNDTIGMSPCTSGSLRNLQWDFRLYSHGRGF